MTIQQQQQQEQISSSTSYNNTMTKNSHNDNDKLNFFYCMTCPYTCPVAQQQERQSRQNYSSVGTTTTTIMKKKRVTIVTDLSNLNQYGKRRMMGSNAATSGDNDILGGKSAWENVDRTSTFCSKCQIQVSAYFVQIQIRSADEPMTIFYKCSICSFQWNE